MKKLFFLLFLPLIGMAQSGDGIDISLEYAGTLTDPNVPVEETGIGDEIYIDVVLNNNDPQYTATWADIWFTFNNEAFEYLGVENPLDGQNNWYTNQWPSVYQFNNAQGYPVDDLYNQYYNGSYWTYVGEENSLTAPLVITSQSSVSLNGVVARLKFKYKPVPNGYDYTDAIIIRKAAARDNNLGYTFTNIKAYPNQIFSNAPISTQLTAKVNIDFPAGIDPTMFIARLYRETTSGVWEQVPGSATATFDTNGDIDMTPGFNLDDTLGIIIDYVGNDIRALYDEIVTISDVSLAFNELANSGINQDETFNELTHVIQAINSDVDNNGLFNFDDTYRLLGHVLGNGTYLESDDLVHMVKLYRTDQYDVINSANYVNYPHGTTLLLPLVVQNSNQLNYVFNGSITWRGDVNLSHSSIPGNMTEVNTVGKSAAKAFKYNANKVAATINSGMVTELKDGKVVMTLTLNPSTQDVVGTQYKVNYDTSKLSFESVEFNTENTATNFGTPKDGYVKFGSIIQTGDKVLTDKTTYTLIFTPKVNLTNALGLVTVSNTDAVNKTGEQLKLEIQ